MRTVFEEDEEELAPQQQGQSVDRELTLSSTTLLAIFFGLVLLCGLFFGLGYTLGRHAPQAAREAASPTNPGSTAETVQAASLPKPSASSGSSASAPVQQAPVEPPAEAQNADSTPETSELVVKPALPAPQVPGNANSSTSQSYPAIKSANQPAAPLTAPQQMTGSPLVSQVPQSFMVQIAAVSNPADADVLVGALQKRGYSVTVRRQPTDALMHVQVGPFSNRLDAVAMRQKLLADGYNAILK